LAEDEAVDVERCFEGSPFGFDGIIHHKADDDGEEDKDEGK